MTETLSHKHIEPTDAEVVDEVYVLPASFAQKRLWFLEQWEPGVYHIPTAVGMKGQMNVEAMEWSVREIIRRHEILRTVFQLVDGDIMQIVKPHMPFSMQVIDLRSFPADVRSVKEQRLAHENFHRPFDLSRGPLVRMTLLQLRDTSYSLLLTTHHIVSDAWSMEVFVHELTMLYAAYVSEQASPLPELSIQYADYAVWQNDWLQGEVLEEQLTYWKSQLDGAPILQLPTDRQRPSMQSFSGAAQLFMFSEELTGKLRNVCRKEGVTLFMVLLAAFKVLLYRYSKQESIVVGIPIAGRTDSKLEPLIGCFINTLALHTDMSGNPTFHELLKRVREVALGAYSHQELPFERLVEELQPERDLSYNPLAQVMFALQNVPRGEVHLPGLVLSPLKLDSETSGIKNADVDLMRRKQSAASQSKKNAIFDLDLTMWEKEENLFGDLRFSTDLFDTQTIIRLLEHFQNLLEAIVADTNQPIDEIELLSEAEWEQQLITWNQTQRHNPLDTSFPQLFEQQVHLTPDAPAVCDAQEQLTYAQLNTRVNQLAHRLVELGVGPDTLVALFAQRGVSLFTAILAIWKAGGAYLPLDLHAPSSRLATIVEQSGTTLVLTLPQNGNLDMEALAAQGEARGLRREIIQWDRLQSYSEENLPVRSTPAHLAYVLYTSGSTGVPKGVMIEQRGMLNHLFAKIHALDLHTQDRLAQTAALSFDISVWQMCAGLLVGAQVRIYAEEVTHDPVSLLEQADRDQISILQVVPSVLRVMLETESSQAPTLSHLRWLVPTGEALPVSLARDWFARYGQIPMLNAYGPTECSDDVAHFVLRASPSETLRSIPIGRPVDNTQLYVLDAARRPVPIGVSGELYVGGVGVGRGYLADEERTASAFVTHRFDEQEEPQRLYKTGDLVRYLADGNLEFLGRLDHQVKIRGFRIELGEIESAFNRHPAVRDNVTIVHEQSTGDKRLITYCVVHAQQTVIVEELLKFVKAYLPDSMIPASVILLEEFPLTPNGKLDRKALPAPDEQSMLRGDVYVAPRNPLEEGLVEIWESVLGTQHIGIHDDFFTLGGHSLLTVRLIAQIQQKFAQRLPLATVFQYRTIEQLAEVIRTHQTSSPWSLQVQGNQSSDDLRADAVLAFETCPEVWPGKLNLEPAKILLTGATGFLGVFLLAELLTQTSADVYCLIRAGNAEAGRDKLQRLLTDAQLWQPAFAARIIPLIGDLALPRLGLSEQIYTDLEDTLDMIYHNGALVNVIYPYQDLKATNVEGTRAIIHLASHGKVKPLNYVSTLSVFDHTANTNIQVIREQEPIEAHCDLIKGGYAQSKWVAETLVTVARSRGLPVAIYRPGRVTGHSQSGLWRHEDVLCRVMKGSVQMGSIPRISLDDTLEMTPVDYVIRAIVALSHKKMAYGQAYNLLNTAPAKVSDVIAWLNAYGYPIQYTDPIAWFEELKERLEQEPDNHLISVMPLVFSQEALEAQIQNKPVLQTLFDNRNARFGLSGSSIVCPPTDEQLLRTYLDRLVEQGFLPSPPRQGQKEVSA